MFRDRARHPWRPMEPWAGQFGRKYLTGATQVLRLNNDRELKALLGWFASEWVPLQAVDGYLDPWASQHRLAGEAPNVWRGTPGAMWDAWGHYLALVGLLEWHEEAGDQ